MKRALRLYRRHEWWLINAAAATAAIDRLVAAVVAGTKVSMGEFVLWVGFALMWIAIQFLTELRGRRAGRRIRAAVEDARKALRPEGTP